MTVEEQLMRPFLQSGALELRLAEDPVEIQAAQALRYRVFVEEMGAKTSARCHGWRREVDRFDSSCDHLLVIDRASSRPGCPIVVGAYRLLRRSVAERSDGFYSAGEFDISSMLLTRGEVLELGRTCIAADHRGGQVVQLLWRGLCNYLDCHEIDLMFGCASLPGTDPRAVDQALSWLHLHHRAPLEFRPTALARHRVDMNIVSTDQIDPVAARRQLPPLLKGYLLAGAVVGDGASIDHDFHMIDVCVLLPCEGIHQRHRRRFQQPVRPELLAAA